MTPRESTRLLALGVSAIILMAGCGRAVSVTPADQIPPACATVHAKLPDSLDGIGARPTSPKSEATAAWGEPPVILRCGVSRPDAWEPTAVLLDIDQVSWFPEPLEAGTIFTTELTGADNADPFEPVYLEVRIPSAYQSPAGILAALGPALS